jgi:hypothetical protein
MKILFNGDSNMSGEELTDYSLGIASHLEKLLGATGTTNLSLCGSSNDRIYDTTMEYIRQNRDVDLVIIGWSEFCRVQWFLTDQGYPEFWEINNLGVGRQPPEEYKLRKENWERTSRNNDYRTGMSHYWHERIYNVHKYFEFHNIPHLFFHAFHDFRINETQYQLDWNKQYFHPYNSTQTYIHWCHDNGFKEITPGWYHYEPDAQEAWANYIFNYIIDNNLLSKK